MDRGGCSQAPPKQQAKPKKQKAPVAKKAPPKQKKKRDGEKASSDKPNEQE